jgi:hypothetical protein
MLMKQTCIFALIGSWEAGASLCVSAHALRLVDNDRGSRQALLSLRIDRSARCGRPG